MITAMCLLLVLGTSALAQPSSQTVVHDATIAGPLDRPEMQRLIKGITDAAMSAKAAADGMKNLSADTLKVMYFNGAKDGALATAVVLVVLYLLLVREKKS
jgi:hypothetical protein